MRKGLQSILPMLVLVISMVFCDSCKRERLIELKANKADTLIYNAGDKLNYDQPLARNSLLPHGTVPYIGVLL